MDAYGNYFSNWYDKFMEEQNELLVKLAKGSYADLFAGKMTATEVFKNVPTKMDSIMAMPSQGAVVEKLMKDYPWSGTVAAAMGGKVAGRYVEEMSGSVLAALNPDIQQLNREMMGMSSAHPAIKGIVERAVELSTMQRRADTETSPEDDTAPNAVEEFVQEHPEEARTIAEEVQHIFLETAGFSKEWWDGLSTDYKRNTFLALVAALHSCFSSATSQSGGLATGADMAMSLFLFVLTAGVLYPESENPESM